MISVVVLPALFAVLVKFWVLFFGRKRGKHSNAFYLVIFVLCLVNMAEISTMLKFQSGEAVDFAMRVYYTVSVWSLAVMAMYVTTIGDSPFYKTIAPYAITMTAILTFLVACTDCIISGGTAIGYAYTAERGEMYWIYHTFAALSFLLMLYWIARGYKLSTTDVSKVQFTYVFFALAPIVFSGFIITALMMSGIKVNAVGIMPIATTAFLLIVLKSEMRHNLTDIRRFLPFSHERILTQQLAGIASRYSMNQLDYKEMRVEFERIAITHFYRKYDEDVARTAEAMGVNRSTVYSMIERHGLRGDKS